MGSLILEDVDLSKTTRHGSDHLTTGPWYLCRIDGRLYVGRFTKQRFGLLFDGYLGGALPYEPPGEFSSWQQIWKIPNSLDLQQQTEFGDYDPDIESLFPSLVSK